MKYNGCKISDMYMYLHVCRNTLGNKMVEGLQQALIRLEELDKGIADGTIVDTRQGERPYDITKP